VPHVASSASAPSQVHSSGSRSRQKKTGRRHCPKAHREPERHGNSGAPHRCGVPGWSLRDRIGRQPSLDLGLLSRICKLEVVQEVLAQHGLGQTRPGIGKVGALLPLYLTVHLVLALCLFPGEPYQEVLQLFWRAWFPGGSRLRSPNKSSLCRARQRLGGEVMAGLFVAIARPLATVETPGAFWRGFRIMAVDGFTMEVAQSEANERAFGGQVDKRRQRVGLPQLHVAALIECGTHAPVDAELGRYDDSERWLAAQLARSLRFDMLVIQDRGFMEVRLWRAYRATGAHLLWRIAANVATKVVKVLDDGTYIAQVQASKKNKRGPSSDHPEPIEVRVIQFRVEGSNELIRLATSLLEPETAPAEELAKLYAERWECEGTYDELKTHQRGAGVVLRSRTPDGVRQEFWAHLIVHHGARTLACEAAAAGNHDPDRISFVLALRLIRRSLPHASFPTTQQAACEAAIAELIEPRSRVRRRHRSYPRTVKRRAGRYPCSLRRGGGSRSPAPPAISLQRFDE
jgi:hypothetical protein